MSLSSKFMVISNLNAENNSLDCLKANSSITNLEIKQQTLKEDWTLLSGLKELKTLTVKDSYIDFKKFYTAICNLPKLKQLTYNHYCFFNKNKKEALPNNLKLPSLKIFRLEFPDEIEPDFDINTYSQKSYQLRNNSITEVKNCHQVFENLEEIQFINYQTYKGRMKDYKADKKKLNSSIYWNMDFKTLNKFKSIKNIHFNDGQPNSLLGAGILEIFLDKIPKKTKFKFNGISSEIPQDLFKNTVINLNHKDEKETNIRQVGIQEKIKELLNGDSSFQKVVELNLRGLYIINNIKDTWKVKVNKQASLLFDTQFTTIIFSPAFNFLEIGQGQTYEIKRAGYYLEFFKSQKKIETVIFDLSKNKDQEWNAKQFSFLVKIMHDLLKQNEKVKIYIFNNDLKKIINSEKAEDTSFKIHLIYLINFYFNYKEEFDQRIIFPGIEEKEMYNFRMNYIQQEVDQIYVVDDKFFESSKKVSNFDLFYKEELEEFKNHYPLFFESNSYDKNLLWKKTLKLPTFHAYQEIFRILGNPEYNEDYFSAIQKDMLTLVVKKNFLKDLKNYNLKNIRKYYAYFGSPWHLIKTHMENNKKKYNIANVSYLDTRVKNERESTLKKLSDAVDKTVNSFIETSEFSEQIKKKEDFLIPLENISYLNDPGLNFEVLENVTHCSLEGVRPWGGKYICLKELDKFLPLNNLEFLRIRDCLAVRKLDLPFMPKLKFLHLAPALSHHTKLQNPKHEDVLQYFENLPSLEELIIDGFYGYFLDHLAENYGYFSNRTNRWDDIDINFSSLHELKKLNKIKLSKIKASKLNRIVALPAVELLEINSVFYVDKEMNPDDKKKIQKPIEDSDLKFLKKSQNLRYLSLELGQCLGREEHYTDFHFCYYKGNGDFIDYINHRLKKLKLTINFNEKDNTTLTDIINKICNRFLKLEELVINFGIATNDSNFDWGVYRYKRVPKKEEIDIKKISKIKDLKSLVINNGYHFINYKIVNFRDLIKLKKITNFRCDFETIPFNEFKEAKKLFQNEKYENPKYYDEEYDWLEQEDKKNWTRFNWINTYGDFGDWHSLASVYKDIEKKHDKPKKVIRKRKN